MFKTTKVHLALLYNQKATPHLDDVLECHLCVLLEPRLVVCVLLNVHADGGACTACATQPAAAAAAAAAATATPICL
jgi:hypothetical protein